MLPPAHFFFLLACESCFDDEDTILRELAAQVACASHSKQKWNGRLPRLFTNATNIDSPWRPMHEAVETGPPSLKKKKKKCSRFGVLSDMSSERKNVCQCELVVFWRIMPDHDRSLHSGWEKVEQSADWKFPPAKLLLWLVTWRRSRAVVCQDKGRAKFVHFKIRYTDFYPKNCYINIYIYKNKECPLAERYIFPYLLFESIHLRVLLMLVIFLSKCTGFKLGKRSFLN